MEENKKSVPVNAEIAEGKKKKHTVRDIIIATVVILMSTACGASEEPVTNTKETQQETQVNEAEEETDEEPTPAEEDEANTVESSEAEKDTFNGRKVAVVGDVIERIQTDGDNDDYYLVTIADINMKRISRPDIDMVNEEMGSKDNYIFYIDIDIDNTATFNATFDHDYGELFIDDYQTDIGWFLAVNDYLGDDIECDEISVAPGRKGKFRYYAIVPADTADSADTIEYEVMQHVFIFKENGQYTCNNNATTENDTQNLTGGELVYGSYSFSPNIYGNTSRANVGFYTDDDGGDYISIYVEADGHTWTSNCYSIVKDGDGYIATDEAGYEYRLTFTSERMTIEEITGSADPDDPSKVDVFNGTYHLDEALNLDEVG